MVASDIKGSSYSAFQNWKNSFSQPSAADEKVSSPSRTATDVSKTTASSDTYTNTKESRLASEICEVKEPRTIIGKSIQYARKYPLRAFVYGLAVSVPAVGLGAGLPLGLRKGSEKVTETAIKDVCGFEKPFEGGIRALMIPSDGSCPPVLKDFTDPGKWERISVIDSKTGQEVTLGGVQKAASWDKTNPDKPFWNYNPPPGAELYSGGWTLENTCLEGEWGGGKNDHTIGRDTDFNYYYVPGKKFDLGDASLFVDEKGVVHNNPNPKAQYRIISTLGVTGNQTLQQVIDSASGLQNLTNNQASLARFADLPIPSPCKGQKLRRQAEPKTELATLSLRPPMSANKTGTTQRTRKDRRVAPRGQ